MASFRSLTPAQLADPQEVENALQEDMGALYYEPLEFVFYAYKWGEGDLEGQTGPDSWQRGFLLEWEQEIKLRNFDGRSPVDPQMFTTVSGHGIGKSAMVAWACDFIPSTRPMCRGTVTANTSTQLHSKTWAEIVKWTKRCATGHWFKTTSGHGSMRKSHRRFPEQWYVEGIAWAENRSEAFAGQHTPSSTSFYVFDEASAIPRVITEVAKGGMVAGEPMMFLFGNGTRNSGYFFETHKDGQERKRFKHFHVDARTSKISNHKLHDSWIEQYGLDSDFVRVRVLGQFPKQSSAQFIPTDIVQAARKREAISTASVQAVTPLLLGVDPARFGDDPTALVYRRGLDAKSIAPRTMLRCDAVELARVIGEENRTRKPDGIIVDVSGYGAGVYDILVSQMHLKNVHAVNFGQRMKGPYAFMNTWMMARLRDWLTTGGILPDSDDLERELTTREYWFRDDGSIMLEPKDELKARGEKSPNMADALSLTFAMDFGPRNLSDTRDEMRGGAPSNEWDYNPYGG